MASYSGSMTTIRLCVVLGLSIMVLASTQFSAVQCRALRSTTAGTGVSGYDEVGGGESLGTASFVVALNNYTAHTREAVRSLAFKLASGPSRRGAGH